LRVLQGIGIAEVAVRDMICDVPLRYYNARGVCFAEVKPSTAHYGWPMRNIFMQQLLEGTLRETLGQRSTVVLRQGHEMLELEQDGEGVTLQVRDAQGEVYQLRADYVIGADGGRSTVRKKLGVELLGLTHARKWVVVDTANDTLDAPYTALHADPQRPFVCIYLPYQQRRWEFMLMEGEDEAKMCDENTIRDLIRGHIGDAVDALNIIRIRAYTHHSRVAARFVQGRVALVGDAAHTIHPLAGQGVNLGYRDVDAMLDVLTRARDRGEKWDSLPVLKRYQTRRRTDNFIMQSGMDLFYVGFSNDLAPVRALRNIGLMAAARAGILKRQALKYALGL